MWTTLFLVHVDHEVQLHPTTINELRLEHYLGLVVRWHNVGPAESDLEFSTQVQISDIVQPPFKMY